MPSASVNPYSRVKAHGETDILFIGDSGGNQNGMTAVATKLNEEWKGGGTRVYALTAYYNDGREHYRAWMDAAAVGYTDDIIGSHAASATPRRCCTRGPPAFARAC